MYKHKPYGWYRDDKNNLVLGIMPDRDSLAIIKQQQKDHAGSTIHLTGNTYSLHQQDQTNG